MGHLCSNGIVSEYWPDFDEANDLFNELTDAKEQLLEDLFKKMRPDVEKINENTNKLIPEINAVQDNTDSRAEQILEQNNANTNRIIAHITSLELQLNELKLNQRTSETCE